MRPPANPSQLLWLAGTGEGWIDFMTAAATGRDPYGSGRERARDGGLLYWLAVLYFVLFMLSMQAMRRHAVITSA